jgi:hypothetical protein
MVVMVVVVAVVESVCKKGHVLPMFKHSIMKVCGVAMLLMFLTSVLDKCN